MKYCPMKFTNVNMNNKYIQEALQEFSENDAWYCTYQNG